MAEKGEPTGGKTEDLERIKRRLDVLDRRLDHIDSVVSAVVERVTKQPVSFVMTCPHCGRNIEVALGGIQKPTI